MWNLIKTCVTKLRIGVLRECDKNHNKNIRFPESLAVLQFDVLLELIAPLMVSKSNVKVGYSSQLLTKLQNNFDRANSITPSKNIALTLR